jgi:hypothetical protein
MGSDSFKQSMTTNDKENQRAEILQEQISKFKVSDDFFPYMTWWGWGFAVGGFCTILVSQFEIRANTNKQTYIQSVPLTVISYVFLLYCWYNDKWTIKPFRKEIKKCSIDKSA